MTRTPYTDAANVAERTALAKAGLEELGVLPLGYYAIEPTDGSRWVLYAVRAASS